MAPEGRFEPLNPNATRDPEIAPAQRSRSRRSSRSLEHALTLSDGYSHQADDDGELQHHPSREKEGSSPSDEDFVVKWDGPDDPENPRNMNLARRWIVVIVVSLGSVCVYVLVLSGVTCLVTWIVIQYSDPEVFSTCASSLYTASYAQLMEEFHVSQIVTTLGLSLFVIGLG